MEGMFVLIFGQLYLFGSVSVQKTSSSSRDCINAIDTLKTGMRTLTKTNLAIPLPAYLGRMADFIF